MYRQNTGKGHEDEKVKASEAKTIDVIIEDDYNVIIRIIQTEY